MPGGSGACPAVPDLVHYTQPFAEELTNKDYEPKARSLAAAGWAM